MQKLCNKRDVKRLALLLTATYMVSYITRTNFGAIVSEISDATGIAKSLLSMPLTGSFITYGVGQLISGVLGDRISPKKLVSAGLFLTVLMNVLLPLFQDPWIMLGIWCINGLAQAFMWPPIVRMMTVLLEAEDYKKTVTQVTSGGLAGTILIYLISPLVISLMGWQGTFYFSAALGLCMLIVWNLAARDVFVQRNVTPEKRNSPLHLLLTPLMLCVLVLIIMQGMLRDGITTWMPSLVSESFLLDNKISILSGVLMPVFSIAGIQLTNLVYRKKLKNPLLCSGVLFGFGGVCAFLLYLFCQDSVVLTIICAAFLIGSLHGVNLLLISMVPRYFEKYGKISTISGVLNACTYIGSAVSTYGIAALSEGIGWSKTVFLWFLIALAGAVLCMVCVCPWKKRFQNSES